MNHFLVKSVALAMVCSFSMAISAQGFLKKVQKGASKAAEVVQSSSDASSQGGINIKDVFKVMPSFTINKVTLTDKNNSDGTPIVKYLLFDENGNQCDVNIAKKYKTEAYTLAGLVIAKVGATTYVGAKNGGVKGAAAGAGAGIVCSAGELLQLKSDYNKLKELDNLLSNYQETFTAEGTPKSAKFDESKIKIADSISSTSKDIKASLSKGNASADEAIKNVDSLLATVQNMDKTNK